MSALRKIEPQPAKTAAMLAYELNRVLNAAKKNDENMGQLFDFFRDNADFFDKVSPLGATVQEALLDKLSASSADYQVLREELRARKRDLLHPQATPAEKLLAENAALCWLRMQTAEVERTAAINSGCSIQYMEYIDKALTRAQNRFTRAVESLERLRALLNR